MDFERAGQRWTESVDVLAIAMEVLASGNYQVSQRDRWIEHPQSGFVFLPMIVGVAQRGGGISSTTTIQANHSSLIPAGLFEYQHSTGQTIDHSIRNGFTQWMKVDFLTLLESARPKPLECTSLQMSLPEKDGKPARHRRAVLGPVAHFRANPAAAKPEGAPGSGAAEEHDFCPCCLLTKSFEAYKELFESDGFYGLRLFAMRNADGKAEADCRVNGEDWPAGVPALQKYVASWKESTGFEFRKQYVILQNADA